MSDLILHEPRVITHQPEYYFGWPTVTRLRNGDLFLVYSGGRAGHVCPFGRVELMVSRDEGETWSWPRVLLDGVLDDRDGGILETARGTLLVTTFSSVAFRPRAWMSKASWQAAARRADEAQDEENLGTWIIRSTDGGRNWSPRIRVPMGNPHGPIQLRDGRILCFGKRMYTEERYVGAWESEDEGLTWKELSRIPAREGEEAGRDYYELHGVEAGDGTLIVHIRRHENGSATDTLQTESHDGGHTWSTPHEIGVKGYPSHLLRRRDGSLLATYSYRHAPYGIRARLSRDHGASWGEELILCDDGANWDLGYPSTVELSSGHLLTVWYQCPEGGKGYLRQREWSFAKE